MAIHSHAQSVFARSGFILFLLAPIVAAPALAAPSQMPLTSLQTPLNPHVAVMGAFVQKAKASGSSSNVKERLYVTVINMSGQPRQAILGKSKVDLPMAQHVSLPVCPGDALRIVSDTNSKIEERFVISEQDAARILIVH
jgi:hypothetical protein